MKRFLIIPLALILATSVLAQSNTSVTVDKFTIQLVGTSTALFLSNLNLICTALANTNVTGKYFTLNGITVTNWSDTIGTLTGLTSNNFAPGSISAAILNSNAVNQNNTDPALSGFLFTPVVRAPDAVISNTAALVNLLTITQGTTNVPLRNVSQQSWVD